MRIHLNKNCFVDEVRQEPRPNCSACGKPFSSKTIGVCIRNPVDPVRIFKISLGEPFAKNAWVHVNCLEEYLKTILIQFEKKKLEIFAEAI